MAYEALTGVRPNDGAHDGETLANILSGKHMPLAVRNRELPKGLPEVIERMMSVSPDHRYPSMDAVIAALDPFTPPLTVHRELAELVLRARPAQTIVMQNGVFVSRPVAHEVVQREPTPKRARSNRPKPTFGVATDPIGPRDHGATLPAISSVPPRASLPLPLPMDTSDGSERLGGGFRWQPLVAAGGALVLGVLSWFVFSADVHPPPPATTSQEPAAKSEPTLAPHVPAATAPSVPATPSASAPSPRVTTAVAPPSAAAPTVAPSVEEAQAAIAKRAGTDPAPDAKPRRAVREKDKDKEKEKEKDSERDRAEEVAAAAAAKANKPTALARVKVFPWGRVWVDGKLQGSVPPILDLNLTPGTHEIAVGHERPMESRNVTLQAGATQLVSFDLEGR